MYNNKKVTVLIAAAGTGQRMGADKPKQFLKLGNKTIIQKTIEAFINSASIDCIYVITKPELKSDIKNILPSDIYNKIDAFIDGGNTRQESIFNGLSALSQMDEIILIHDAARPYVTPSLIEDIVRAVDKHGAAIPVIPVKDTIKEVKDSIVTNTPIRSNLFGAQTPQGFEYGILMEAYEKAIKEKFVGTDDAQLVEYLGRNVHIVEGNNENIKITTVDDLPNNKRVVGLGFDVHGFDSNRDLILGGIKIPYNKGLLGHSDADVLTHALMDAMLGALNLGDIGTNFPDTDNAYKDISSIRLLNNVNRLMKEAGYFIENIDMVIVAEKPKMKEYIPIIKENISEVLNIDNSRVSIKATTTEGLGFTGREEGIGAQVIVQLISL